MTFIEAAAEVLRTAGKPLHYKEITELAIAKNLLSHVGKTPEVTMSHRLTSAIKKDDEGVPIVKVRPGVFALREWGEGKGKKGAAARHADAEAAAAAPDAGVEVNALEIEAALSDASNASRARDEDDDDDDGADEGGEDDEPGTPVSGEEALRADLAARGAELFDDEDDDDQPILGQPGQAAQPGQPGAGPQGDGGRRRRRRRRRGRGGNSRPDGVGFTAGERSSQPRLEGGERGERPAATGAPAGAEGEWRDGTEPGEGREARDPLGSTGSSRPVVRDRNQIMAGGLPTGIDVPIGEGREGREGEELAGRDLADAAAVVLSSLDRGSGPPPIRVIAEALMRRGRLQGDPAVAVAQTGAALRADNLRRGAGGQRPRFRFSGGHVALTDWSLGGDLARLEQEVVASIERYREASRRALLRRLQELPGHALVELILLALERAGMNGLKPVRRAGSPGGEAHFAAIHKTGSDAIPTALVVRKDGREIGRERVTDLRGALHHYGPASTGWLVTTGQVLSGAREEASAPGAPPVALYDGIALCKLLEELDVGVIKTRFSIAIPDVELLETLRA
ncbi:MAG: HTH domain-containing protein [Polyangiaceae bacterium]